MSALLRLRFGLLVLFSFLAGCQEDPPPPPVKAPFEGEAVQIALPQDLQVEQAWAISLDEWAAQTGADYAFHRFDSQLSLPNASADVLIFPLSQLPQLALDHRLAELPPNLQGLDGLNWQDLLPGLRESIGTVEREPRVIPLSVPVLVCYYRADLLEAAGLEPPGTWDDYLKLLQTQEEWTQGLPILEPWGEPYRATMFLAHAISYARLPSNFSLYFDIDSGKPMIDSPGFVTGLKITQEICSHLPEKTWGMSPAECRSAILSGQAAMVIATENGSWSTGGNPPSKNLRNKEQTLGFVPLPGALRVFNTTLGRWEEMSREPNRMTLVGFQGWGAAVAAGREETRTLASWNVLQYLNLEVGAAAVPKSVRSPVRVSHRNSTPLWVGEALAPGEGREYVTAVTQSLSGPTVAEIPVIQRDRFLKALSQGLLPALKGEQPAEDALKAIAAQWEALRQEIGPRRVLNSYRLSTGLTESSQPSP